MGWLLGDWDLVGSLWCCGLHSGRKTLRSCQLSQLTFAPRFLLPLPPLQSHKYIPFQILEFGLIQT